MNELKERIARLRQAIAENSDEVAQNLEDNINTISLYSKENAYEIMNNPKGWVFVHATNYEPKNNEKAKCIFLQRQWRQVMIDRERPFTEN